MSTLLQVENLGKHYPLRGGVFSRAIGTIKAVDGVNFSIQEGSSFGLVGESGSGKSTLARCVLRLEEPSFGAVRFNSVNILQLPPEEMRRRRAEMQIVFQDPYASLNPRLTVRDIIAEPLIIHTALPAKR
jgi:oligopeptide transport system ATP-binding protein